MTINDQSDDTQTKFLEECGFTLEQYGSALGCVLKKYSVLYKWKPGEVNIRPYNTVILKLLKSKMNHNLSKINIYIYGMLMYLTLYLFKPEHTIIEPMEKASKEAYHKEEVTGGNW